MTTGDALPLVAPAGLDPATDGPLAHGTVGDSYLHVAWTKGEHVQVALEVDVQYAELAQKMPNGSTDQMTFLWTPVLGREEINALIRTLRRARDAAYGADE